MITGYFYVDVQNSRREVIQIKKIFWLFLLSNVTYLLWGIIIRMPCGKNEIMLFLSEIFHWKTMLIFVFFNESPIQPHLWYLGAVLYVLVIVRFLKKLFKTNFDAGLCILSTVFLVMGFIFGSYSLVLLHKIYPEYVFRNFLCEGIPFFSIGYFLRKKKKSYAISRLFRNKIVSRTEIYPYYNLCRPVAVYSVSVVTSVLLIKLKSKLKGALFQKNFVKGNDMNSEQRDAFTDR